MNQDTSILDYHGPSDPSTPRDCFVDEGKLAIRAGKSTPDRCVKCNEPTGGLNIRAKFRPPLMMQGGVFYPIFLVEQLITRPSAAVNLSVCPKCHARRNRWVAVANIAAGLSVIAVGAGACIFAMRDRFSHDIRGVGFIMVLAGLLALLGSIRWRMRAAKVLRFHATNGQLVWLKGADKQFLQSLS